jgi:hypothetical protein
MWWLRYRGITLGDHSFTAFTDGAILSFMFKALPNMNVCGTLRILEVKLRKEFSITYETSDCLVLRERRDEPIWIDNPTHLVI